MIVLQSPPTIGLAILSLGKRETKSLPTRSALTESPERAADSSPGSASLRAQPWVKPYKNPAADSEAARSAKFICGSPIRPISRIRPILPHRPISSPKIKESFEPFGKRRKEFVPPMRDEGRMATERAGASESNRIQAVTNQKIIPLPRWAGTCVG